jgi:hypothetical protein
MNRLLRLDFRRLFKDTAAIVVFVIIAVVAGFNVLAAASTAYVDPFTHEVFRMLTAKEILMNSFQLGSTPYLLIGVLIGLFIGKDITHGTIRNKIIAGYSKVQIYFSTLIISLVITLIGMVIYQGIVAAFIPIITFPISTTAHELQNILIYLALGYLLILVTSTIATFISLLIKNTAGAIILIVVVLIFGPTLALLVKLMFDFLLVYNRMSIFTNPLVAQATLNDIENVFEYFYFFQATKFNASIFTYGGEIINFYETEGRNFMWKMVGTSVGLIGLASAGGAFLFKKSDLK